MDARRPLAAALASTWLLALAIVPGSVLAAQVHDVSFSKTCESSTAIGDAYACQFQVQNDVDGGQDTIVISSLADTVHAATGDAGSGPILGIVQVTVSGGASCDALGGAGTVANPYISVSACTLPFGSTVSVLPYSFYNVAAGDYGLSGSTLTDTASLGWHNTCTASGIETCTVSTQTKTANGFTLVTLLASGVTTTVRDASNNDITGTPVAGGTVVHDVAVVTGESGKPIPGGTVSFTLYDNGTCDGAVLATDANEALDFAGVALSATFTLPASSGSFSYLARYNGDASYGLDDADCEAFTVVGSGGGGGSGGSILAGSTTCADFVNGTGTTLSDVAYRVRNGKVDRTTPGTFFYDTFVTVGAGDTVTTTQQATHGAPLFSLNQGHAWIYTDACTLVATSTVKGTTLTYTFATAGTYVLRLQYATKSIVGRPAPSPDNAVYTFDVSGAGTATMNLTRQ